MPEGTVTAFTSFDAEDDCKKLRKAMKGLGTDEKAIIAVIPYRSNTQRQELKLKFKTMYGKDLVEDLEGELRGDLEKVMVGLMMTPAEFDAFSIKNAVAGLGTDEATLIEILCSRTNEELQAMKVAYKKMYDKEMEKAVASDVSGDVKRALVSLITAHRDPDGPVDSAKVTADAKELYKAGEGRLGTDESTFNAILVAKSYAFLRALYAEYEKISGHPIESAIVKEMSGDTSRAYLTIVECSKNPALFFAGRLYKSMKGLGTDETTLNRVMISRSEVDLEDIKKVFHTKYSKSLYDFIKDDISGDYERVLLAICRQ